jgi:hypothetical protein
MVLPSSGPISLNDIQTEFGGSNPISISEYYNAVPGIPASGTITFSDFYGTSSALYQFTSHTFTNAGATGRNGPTLTQCRNAYNVTWDGDTSLFNVVTQGVQRWTVPSTGTYEIEAEGASGGIHSGSYNPAFPGSGATAIARFSLNTGDILNIVVGQKPTSTTAGTENGAAGGGGSWVYTGAIGGSGLMMVAGGGGGTGHGNNGSTGGNGRGGSSTTNSAEISYEQLVGTGANARVSNASAGNKGIGEGGKGTPTNSYGGSAGGAGWNSNGDDDTASKAGGGTRWIGGTSTDGAVMEGGFGGGGGSGGNGNAGGGGGGYTGGGAGRGWEVLTSYNVRSWGGGAGGGTYISSSGTNKSITAGTDAISYSSVHEGYVKITKI